ncbi:hypothetical protein ACWD4L_49780, partial [Streptomyces sp. NPDC002596]
LILLFLLTACNCFLRDLPSQYQAVQVKGGASLGAMALFGSAPAHAADRGLELANGRGTMWYTDDGDHFTACDTKADGYGVHGSLWRIGTDGAHHLLTTVDDGGDAGCDQVTYDIKNGAGNRYYMLLCWNGDPTSASCVESGLFWE